MLIKPGYSLDFSKVIFGSDHCKFKDNYPLIILNLIFYYSSEENKSIHNKPVKT